MATGGEEEVIPGVRREDDEDGEAEADKTCGICLAEGVEDRGTLESCEHIFCFPCIMEWSRVESRCPFCKRRFERITRAGGQKGPKKFRVPLRNQTYVPSDEDVAAYAEVYSETACTVCGTGDDDALLLLCDGCDSAAHTYCVGFGSSVPQGDYFCGNCRGRVDEGLLEVFGPESGGSDGESSDSGSDIGDEDLEERLGRVVRTRVPRRTARAQEAAAAAAGPSSASGRRAPRPRRQAPAQVSAGPSSSRHGQSGGSAGSGRVWGRAARHAARAASMLTMQRRCALLDRVQNLRQHYDREQRGRSGASISAAHAQPGGQPRAAGGRVQQPVELGPDARAWQMLDRAQSLVGRGAAGGGERSPAASVVRRTAPEVSVPTSVVRRTAPEVPVPSSSFPRSSRAPTGTGSLVQCSHRGGASGSSSNLTYRGAPEPQQGHPSGGSHWEFRGPVHPNHSTGSYSSMPPPPSLQGHAVGVTLPLKRALEGCSRPRSTTANPCGLDAFDRQLASGGGYEDSGSWQRVVTSPFFQACPQPHPQVEVSRPQGVSLSRGNFVQGSYSSTRDALAAHLQPSQLSGGARFVDGYCQAASGSQQATLPNKSERQGGSVEAALPSKSRRRGVMDKKASQDFKERIVKAVKQHITPRYHAGDIDKESSKALARKATHIFQETLEHPEQGCSHVNHCLKGNKDELEICGMCVLLAIKAASLKLDIRIHSLEVC